MKPKLTPKITAALQNLRALNLRLRDRLRVREAIRKAVAALDYESLYDLAAEFRRKEWSDYDALFELAEAVEEAVNSVEHSDLYTSGYEGYED